MGDLPDDETETETESVPVTLRAHAKLTVSLKLTGLRADGYHLIDAEMVSLDLHDVLTFTPHQSGIVARGRFAAGMPTDDSNLVARALRLAGSTARVEIHKSIPHGGGLGGGSTDAATALRWAGFGTGADDLVTASSLGADISFCLVGGRARVTGIGDIVDPLPHTDRTFTLVIPPLSISTPAAYAAWDELGMPVAEGPNDLEAAALAVEPQMQRWRDMIAQRVGAPPTLAGSGATWFVDGEKYNTLADLIGEGATIVVAHSVPSKVATSTR